MTGTAKANENETAGSKTGTPLTQNVVNAILAADPKTGRRAVAVALGIPDAQVWAVRVVAGMTKVDAKATAYCKARLDRAGVSIPKAKAVRKPRATKVAA